MIPRSQATEPGLLRVASLSTRNTQQMQEFERTSATRAATTAQPLGLKALALLALERNTPATKDATTHENPEKVTQQIPDSGLPFVAHESAVDSVALLRVARGATAQQIEIRDRLLMLAEREVIDPAAICDLAGPDFDGCAGLSDATLIAYLRALRDSAQRELGQCPSDETAVALCRSCGPIWIAPEVASVAPVVQGWPRVLGCPWCHVNNRQAIPRPAVGECRPVVGVPDLIKVGAR